MKHLGKGKGHVRSKKASEKSLRLIKGTSRACCNPLCRKKYTLKKKDHRFCGQQCKDTFFRVKYGLLELAPYFDLQLTQGPKIDG